MGDRRKTLNIWLKRTRDRGGVEGTRPEAKDTKKYPRPKTALSRTDLSRARTQVQVFSKKNVFKNFFLGVLKKQNQKISKKTSFSTKNDLQNFKDFKNTAVLEPRTGQFSRT